MIVKQYVTIQVRTSQETHYVTATKPNRLVLIGKQSLFVVRMIRNTQIQCVGRMQASLPAKLKQVVHIVTAAV
jgi:hypothetical protein